MRNVSASLVPVILLAACAPEQQEDQFGTVMQAVRAGEGEAGDTFLGADLLVTETDGSAIPCGQGEVTFTLEVSRNGEDGPYQEIESARVYRACSSASQGQLALVLDNSGSLEPDLAQLKSAAHAVSQSILGHGGTVSLTRVSTNAEVLTQLTDDQYQLSDAIDGMFVNHGWTALYDGIRMAGETLGEADQRATVQFQDAGAFCNLSSKRGIVAFTDSEENNSSGQSLTSAEYPGDGIDTSLKDLEELQVNGSTTPIYTVGFGDAADNTSLEQLAAATGGRHVRMSDPSAISDVLEMLAKYGESTHRVCSELPDHLCGSLHVRITHHFDDGTRVSEGTTVQRLEMPCHARAQGRVATILLTLDVAQLSEGSADRLIAQTVDWVSPVDAPSVLFVRDDFHHGEYAQDTADIYHRLQKAGYVVSLMDEPSNGASLTDFDGFDVVWFSNPGYPMDDLASFNALLQFSENGGGVVLQGDDMSWSYGKAFSTTPLTRLEHVDNGTNYCGVRVDNGRGGAYRVNMEEGTHPILAGLAGESFLYDDDIDTAWISDEALADAEVLAWATIDGKENCSRKPVIVAYTPPRE